MESPCSDCRDHLDLLYWKKRCLATQVRMNQLEEEIRRLKGYGELTQADIEMLNGKTQVKTQTIPKQQPS